VNCCLCNSKNLIGCTILQQLESLCASRVFILFSLFKKVWVVLQSRRKAADNSKRRDEKSTSDTEDESEEEKAEEDEEEEEQEQENVEEQNENGALEKSDAEISEHSESEEKNESVEESEENSGKCKKRSATSLRKKAPYGKAKTRISVSHKSSPSVKRTPKKSSSKHILSDEDSDASPKVSPMKKTEKVSKQKHLPSKKSTSKENTGKFPFCLFIMVLICGCINTGIK